MKDLKIETNDKKEKSMKYYNFFTKVYLPIVTVLNGIIVCSDLNNIQNFDGYSFCIMLINIIVYIILPIYLIADSTGKTKFQYDLLLFYLTLEFICHIVIGAFNASLSNPNVKLEIYLCVFFIIYSIWYTPNMIYFTNRKDEFKN